jgi:hypothetical protein
VGVVDETVADRVDVRGLGDVLVPALADARRPSSIRYVVSSGSFCKVGYSLSEARHVTSVTTLRREHVRTRRVRRCARRSHQGGNPRGARSRAQR